MNAVNAHSADCIQRNDQGLKVLTVLYRRFYIIREIAAVSPPGQRAADFHDVMRGDINFNNCINDLPTFSQAEL